MSLYYLSMLSIMGFIAALITLSLQRKHFLGILLSLEAATLNLFIMMFIISNNMTYEGQNSLILITLGACEASLGLAILVAVIRSKGNDYVSSFTLQKC